MTTDPLLPFGRTLAAALREQIVSEDHRLEQQVNSTARALMEHRWHWTRDVSNPAHMSMRAYAALVSRSYATIHRYAKGYEILLADPRGDRITPDDARARADMSGETELATEAVAAARGVSFHQAREQYGPEVRSVREDARRRVEGSAQRRSGAGGVSFEEAAQQSAALSVQYDRSKKRKEEESKRTHTFRYLAAEGLVAKIRSYSREHLRELERGIEGVRFEAEERDLLAASLQELSHELQEMGRVADALCQQVLGNRVPDWRSMMHVVAGDEEEPTP